MWMLVAMAVFSLWILIELSIYNMHIYNMHISMDVLSFSKKKCKSQAATQSWMWIKNIINHRKSKVFNLLN